VSSFGISGTNAHVVVEHVPAVDVPSSPAVDAPWVLSAKSPEAVRDMASGLLAVRAAPGDVAWSLARRTAFPHRAVVLGDVPAGLQALGRGEPAPNVVTGTASVTGGVAFVFPGQGSQWSGMALDLYRESPEFAARLDECSDALRPYVDWDLVTELSGALDRVDVVQPALWAVMVSLAELWRWHGITPDAVVGHSQGEIAAAAVAGALSLDDAAKVVALRAKALRVLAGRGGMVSIPLPVAEVRALLPDGVAVAAVNGPSATVVSGNPEALDRLVADHPSAKRIPVDYAAHSPQVEAIRDELRAALADVRPRRSSIPFYSSVTGAVVDPTSLDADYWYRNLREPVEFHDAVRTVLSDGFGGLLECSPHPVLTAALPDGPVVLSTLRRDDGGRFPLALAEAHVNGLPVDWKLPEGRPVDLPAYPFRRQRYWLSGDLDHGTPSGHPLLRSSVRVADGVLFAGRLSVDAHPWLADHAVLGDPVVPGAALVELAAHAGARLGCPTVAELVLHAPLTLPAEVQLAVGAADDGRRTVTVHSRQGDDWTLHAAGVLAESVALHGFEWPQDAEPIDLAGRYDRLADRGYHYGPAFRGLRGAWRSGDDLYAEVALPVDAGGFDLHPALLDAALHVLDTTELEVPFSWTGVRIARTEHTELRVRVRRAEDGYAISAVDHDGVPVLDVESLVLRPLATSHVRTPLSRLDWVPLPVPDTDQDVELLHVVGDGDPTSHRTVLEVLAAVREHLASERGKLVVVTREAVGDHVTDLAAAPVWGLIRSVIAEHPDRVSIVDSDEASVHLVAKVAVEPQVLLRAGEAWVPKVVPLDVVRTPDADWHWTPSNAAPWRTSRPSRGPAPRWSPMRCGSRCARRA
jgi:acyl transferase domain-containing protein